MDFDYGLQLFSKYLHDVDLVERGVAKFSDFGYSEQRNLKPICNVFENPKVGYAPAKIAEIDIRGAMRLESGISHRGMEDVARDIERLEDDVDGIMLNIYSGGGEILSIGVIENALKDFGKPFVAYGHFMGSAAYWVASGANEIILSSESAMAGSIGAYVSLDKFVIDWLKENYEDIYADSSPDKNKEIREYMEGNKQPFQDRVNLSAEMFRETIRERRGLETRSSNMEKALAGGMFMANEAKALGLIDGIGTKKYAYKRLLFHINN